MASFIPPNSPAMYLFHISIRVGVGSLESRAWTQSPIPLAISRALVFPLTSYVHESRQYFMKGVIGCPELGRLGPIGGPLLQHDELVWRVGADIAFSPVPIIVADTRFAQIGIVGGFPRCGRDLGRIGYKGPTGA